MRKLVALLVGLALVAAGCGGNESSESDAGSEIVATGQVPFDLAFIDAMIPHHQIAIEMAKAAKARELTQPDLDAIADDIIATQQLEIDRMLDWRAQWFGSRSVGAIQPEVLGLPESELGMEHGGWDEVMGAGDVDATFAELMIPHHAGAIVMAEAASERAQHQEIQDLASQIVEAQEQEIEIMEKHASVEHHG